MRPLRYTPLHPQWLILRLESERRAWVRENARGLVLDVGSADGHVRDWLLDCEYIAVDYPVTVKQMYGTRPHVFADGAALPIADASIDTVLLLEVLEHVRDPCGVLASIARVLKPGGLLLLSVPFLYPLHDAPHDYRRYSQFGLEEEIRKCGLLPSVALPSNRGFETAALLAAIACAEVVIEAWRHRSWRLLAAPFALASIPVINVLGWLATRLYGGCRLLATGHAIAARRPS